VGALTDRAHRGAAHLLRRTLLASRDAIPPRFRPAVLRLRPLLRRAYRATEVIEASDLKAREQELREAIARAPGRGHLWWELGLNLDAQRRHDETMDAWLRAAEQGPPLQRVLFHIRLRPPLWERATEEPYASRIRALAAADPTSSHVQLLVGAFLLDSGDLEAGRAMVRRGYRLTRPELFPAPASGEPEPPSLDPSFLVLGPPKSGTTSLYSWLAQHPRVIAAPRKELRFWRRGEAARSLEDYRAYFPPQPSDAGYATGEATPGYLQSEVAAAEVAAGFPRLKTIVLHRDPVARAYSNYQMTARMQSDHRSFEEAIEQELFWFDGTPPLHPEQVPRDVNVPYLLGSCILPFIRIWSDALGPEQVMVIESDELSAHRQQTLDAVFEYLGLAPHTLPQLPDLNVGEYDPIAPETRARLEAWFAPHEEALAAFLDGHPARIPRP
jgi:hypothetical protein